VISTSVEVCAKDRDNRGVRDYFCRNVSGEAGEDRTTKLIFEE
jgi:hypothetical protein